MIDLFRRPDCVIHEVNVTVDPDRCVKCGAVNRWTIPVDLDYEAAAQAVKDAWLIDDRHTMKLLSLVTLFVDAAVGKEER